MNSETGVQRKPWRGLPGGRPRPRRGSATVELAVCMPILLTVGLGMIEATHVVFVQAQLQEVAYEAVRLATRPTTSYAKAAGSDEVAAYAQALLGQLGVNGGTVTVTPSSLSNLPPQTLVTVSISAPLSQNTVSSFVVKNSLTLSASATLIIE